MVDLTDESYTVLKQHYATFKGGECMMLNVGNTTKLPNYPGQIDELIRQGIVEVISTEEAEEGEDESPSDIPEVTPDEETAPVPVEATDDIPHDEDAEQTDEDAEGTEDEKPGEYGKANYPCLHSECPEGRNEGGEPGPYVRERDLQNHLKRNPDCAKFHNH